MKKYCCVSMKILWNLSGFSEQEALKCDFVRISIYKMCPSQTGKLKWLLEEKSARMCYLGVGKQKIVVLQNAEFIINFSALGRNNPNYFTISNCAGLIN